MLSFDHEILVDLFRENARLAAELLETCAGITVNHARVDRESIDLSHVAPAAYYTDAVAILRDGDDRPVTGVIVEVQRQIERRKLLTWPAYVATLRAKLDCAAVLLVVAPSPEIAAWARQPIELGHPGFCLTPIVIGFEDVPWVRDREAASRLPELATLSAMAHPELEIAEVAIDAVSQLPEDRRRLYLEAILMALPAEVRRILEVRMLKGYEYRSDYARTYYGQGREAGLRTAVLALAGSKLGELSESDIVAIEAISDPRALTELITALGQAHTVVEVRAALDRALDPQSSKAG
jgi:hypothetical protein